QYNGKSPHAWSPPDSVQEASCWVGSSEKQGPVLYLPCRHLAISQAPAPPPLSAPPACRGRSDWYRRSVPPQHQPDPRIARTPPPTRPLHLPPPSAPWSAPATAADRRRACAQPRGLPALPEPASHPARRQPQRPHNRQRKSP